MPNALVPAVGGALPAWLPTAPDIARAILHNVTSSLTGLHAEIENELVEHARCRRDVEALIERLIDGLDAVDGDPDLEPFEEGDELDRGEEVNEDGDPTEGVEPTTGETYGRGWDDASFQASRREDLFCNAVRPALFLSWKSGRCTSAALIPSNRGARA